MLPSELSNIINTLPLLVGVCVIITGLTVNRVNNTNQVKE